jgi:hypothetical protein
MGFDMPRYNRDEMLLYSLLMQTRNVEFPERELKQLKLGQHVKAVFTCCFNNTQVKHRSRSLTIVVQERSPSSS